MRRASRLALAAVMMVATACAVEEGEPGDPGGPGGKADDGVSVESIGLYNPLGFDRPLAYVDQMDASLLSTALDDYDPRGDRLAVMEQLDTPEHAYLMMALAGMEYYPVGTAGEEDLDATLASVVAHGNPDGDTSRSTGLSLLTTVKKPALGFRADIVRVNDRPHYVIAVRGTQIKQPSFVQTFANGLADLSAAAIEVDALPESIEVDSFGDLIALKNQLADGLSRTDFSDRDAVAHAGIFLAAVLLEQDIHDVMVDELDLEFPADVEPCVWVTGHSLGGGMAPLIAYRLVQSRAFNTRAKLCGVYTYGAPRVANEALVARYNGTRHGAIFEDASIDLGSVTFRYQLEDDPIPHVPPNIPRDDDGSVAELVAELLMAVVRAYGPEIASVDGLAQATNGKLEGLSERESAVASVLYGAGSFLRDIYRIMDEHGVIDRVEDTAYQAAKAQVAELVSKFRKVQHLGHTRWIDRLPTGEYRMATGTPTQQHHLAWMMSLVTNLRLAACADRNTGTSANVEQQVSNALGFHRTPFYAAVLLMHTGHAGGDRRFSYPDSDRTDRLEAGGISFYEVENFERTLEEMYDAERRTYLSCE